MTLFSISKRIVTKNTIGDTDMFHLLIEFKAPLHRKGEISEPILINGIDYLPNIKDSGLDQFTFQNNWRYVFTDIVFGVALFIAVFFLFSRQ